MAEEKEESPKGKRCKIISHPDVSSTGCHTNYQLIILVLARWIWEQQRHFHSCGMKKGKKKQNTNLQISGQSKMLAYLTVSKTVLKTDDNTHINHQHIPQTKTEYSLVTFAETIKTRGKPETI